MRPHPDVPLFVTCQRPGCGQIREVRFPSQQKRGKYCSNRCQMLHRPCWHLGWPKGVAVRKQKVRDRIEGLTLVEAFNLGYRAGLVGKLVHIRKRYDLVKKAN